jgi:hypothetical protein
MTPKNRYNAMKLYLSMNMDTEVRRECFKLQISKQAFIRALVKDYFLRTHGIDLELKSKERIAPIASKPEGNSFLSEDELILD